MPGMCCVAGCKTNYQSSSEKNVSVFHFPKDQNRINQWTEAIHREKFTPSKNSVVCIKHFDESHIIREHSVKKAGGTIRKVPRTRLKLTNDAFPSIFPNRRKYRTVEPAQKRKAPEETLQESNGREYNAFKFVDIGDSGKCKVMLKDNFTMAAEVPMLCRACLIDQDDCLTEVVKFTRMTEKIIEMFTFCTSIQISKLDGLPLSICQQCVNNIQTCYDFIKTCKSTDSVLKRCLSPDKETVDVKQETLSTADIKDEIIENNDDFKDLNVPDCDDHNYATLTKVHNKTDSSVSSAAVSSRDVVVFPCNLCPKIFRQNFLLRRHKKTHEPKTSFKCDQCPKTFRLRSVLNNHVKTHSELVNILCQICGAGFKDRSYLARHMRSHTGYKPYVCRLCPYKATLKSGLDRHYRTHNNARKYKCPICQRGFNDGSDLSKHLKTHTGERPHKCDLCPSSFIKNWNRKTHMQKIHKIPVEAIPKLFPKKKKLAVASTQEGSTMSS